MFEAAGNGGDALVPREVVWCERAVGYAVGVVPEGEPGVGGGFRAHFLLGSRDRDGVDDACGGEGDDAVAGDGERREILAAEGVGGWPVLFGVACAPLQKVSFVVNSRSEVPVELEVAEKHAIEELYPSWSFDEFLV